MFFNLRTLTLKQGSKDYLPFTGYVDSKSILELFSLFGICLCLQRYLNNVFLCILETNDFSAIIWLRNKVEITGQCIDFGNDGAFPYIFVMEGFAPSKPQKDCPKEQSRSSGMNTLGYIRIYK